MPAPYLPMVPTQRDGSPAPGFGGQQGYGGGMGDFMSMNQVNPGPAAAAGAQPWQGPWVNMNELQTGAPLDLAAQYPQGLSGAAGPTVGYPGQYPGGLAGPGGPPPLPRGGGKGKMVLCLGVGAAAMFFLSKTKLFK